GGAGHPGPVAAHLLRAPVAGPYPRRQDRRDGPAGHRHRGRHRCQLGEQWPARRPRRGNHDCARRLPRDRRVRVVRAEGGGTVTGWATAILMLVGSVFTLLAATGVLKLPDAVMRMQASAKASTLGLACLLLGAAFQLPDLSSVVRLMSLGGFLMATAPLSAHIVARATLSRGAPLWEGL